MPTRYGINTRAGRPGGRVSVSGLGRNGTPSLAVRARIEGVEKTSAEFKRARREFNAAMRTVIQQAGEKSVLPAIRHRFPRGKTGKSAASLYVQRDRTTVYIGSHLRGAKNRALGWIDFGGKRRRDHRRRRGLYVIITEVTNRRPLIEEAILQGLMRTFSPLEHKP